MGAAAVRITPEDFLIPPEFQGLDLAHRSPIQIGGLRLRLEAEDGKIRLAECYQQIPLRVLPPFHFASEPAALLYLINPTAGLLDGDGHFIDLSVGPGVRAVVTGQSATRVHPCPDRFATQQWRIHVADGGELVVLPGPAIPFRGCRYYQRVEVDLEPKARFIWGDIWLPGRYARAELSEQFQFDRLVQDLEVRRGGGLVFRDRFSWRGPWDQEAIRWHLGRRQAGGSLFITGGVEAADASNGLERVVLPLDSGDTCVRWCGTPSEVTADVVRLALGQAGGWLLNSHCLAPNHWFATG